MKYRLQIILAAVLAAYAATPSVALAREAQDLRMQLRGL